MSKSLENNINKEGSDTLTCAIQTGSKVFEEDPIFTRLIKYNEDLSADNISEYPVGNITDEHMNNCCFNRLYGSRNLNNYYYN